jgi:hypothetical protein
MGEKKKKFILGLTAISFLVLAGRAVLAGIIQATASFFVKRQWDKWKDEDKA